MSFTDNIEFHRHSQGNSSNQQSTSPDRGSQTSGQRPGSPAQQSQTASPNPDTVRSERDLDQLRSHAIISARRDRLSTTAEERLIDFAQLPLEEKLIDLCSKVFRIEQQVDRSEASAGESQSTRELPTVPKQISNDIRYKAALLMVSTAEDTHYHDGLNKPATMIMDSLRGRQDFDKSWLSDVKGEILRVAVGKVCGNARYDLKCQIAESVEKKYDVLTLTVNAVSHLSKWCGGDIVAHEALAIRMAILRAVFAEDSSPGFWVTVDKKLEEIRKGCTRPGAISFTEALNQIYKLDLVAYPPKDLALALQANPTAAQSEMDRHVCRRSQVRS